jgi:hypothetical protein
LYGDALKAFRTWRSRPVLWDIKGYDKIAWNIDLAASAKSNGKVREPCICKALVELDSITGPTSKLVVAMDFMARIMGISARAAEQDEEGERK